MLSRILASTLILFSSISAVAEIPDVNDFRVVPQFPQTADGAFGVVGTSTPFGRFILWDGETVFRQTTIGGHEFLPIATGYIGDPGFLAVSPNGQTLLMGAGFSPTIYLLNLANPQDYEAGDEIDAPDHFSGAFLNGDLIILDRTTDDLSATELVVLSIAELTNPGLTRAQQSFQSVITLPAVAAQDLVIDKPLDSYSAHVFVNQARTLLYAMDGNTRELRSFAVADIIAAFNNETTLDWATDGTLIGAPGDFFSGGVAGQTPDGELIIDGAEGFGLPGGVMFVDPTDPAIVLATLDPAGDEPFYQVIYSRATDELIAIDATFGEPVRAYARTSGIDAIPPRNPCDDFDDIFAQWEAFAIEFELNPTTADFDADGIPEKAILTLMRRVTCGVSSKVRTATLVAYDNNLDAFDAEDDFDALSDYRELFAILMAISIDTQESLNLILAEDELALDGSYLRVTCDAGLCEPEFVEKPFEALVTTRSAIEPYSGSGDFDNDGTTNLIEYNRVIANGGNYVDFALHVSSANLNGNSTLERHSSSGGGGCFIATAAYGTPLANEINELRDFRDTYLMATPLGSTFVDTYYRISPAIADEVAQHSVLRSVVRVALAPVVFIAKLLNQSSLFMVFGAVFVPLLAFTHLRRKRATHPTQN